MTTMQAAPRLPFSARPSVLPSAPLAALALAVLLSGCQLADQLSTWTGGPATEQSPALAESQAAGPPDVATAPAAPEPLMPVDDDPAQFLGLNGVNVAGRLGEPDLIRRDGSAEVRQFRGSACILDLFLYPADGSLAVKHVELRGPSLDLDGRRACLADMIRSRTLAG